MLSIKDYIGFILKSFSNIHIHDNKKDVFLFSTARGGSTWLMEILASQPGMKYYDEPFNIRRSNVQYTGLFEGWNSLMPEGMMDSDIISYLKLLQSNKYKFMNPPPFRKNHRILTNRSVFKIHELEHLVNDVRDQCDGLIVYLIRHPISNTLSRYVYPRLELFIKSKYYRDNYLDTNQISEITKIYENGTKLQKGIVSWCYENLIPINHMDKKDWLVVSYEELLLNSEKVCETMADFLLFEHLDKMLAALNTPSANISMSKKDTLDILKDPDEIRRKQCLVKKWKTRISAEEEKECFNILELFGLDIYHYDRFISDDKYLLHHDTIDRLNHI